MGTILTLKPIKLNLKTFFFLISCSSAIDSIGRCADVEFGVMWTVKKKLDASTEPQLHRSQRRCKVGVFSWVLGIFTINNYYNNQCFYIENKIKINIVGKIPKPTVCK